MYVMTITAYSYRNDDFDYIHFANASMDNIESYKEIFLEMRSAKYDRINFVIYYYPYSERRFISRGVLYE